MPGFPKLLSRPRYLGMWLPFMAVLIDSCGGVGEVVRDLFTVKWIFVNNSADPSVLFIGDIRFTDTRREATLAAHASQSLTAVAAIPPSNADISVAATSGATTKVKTIPFFNPEKNTTTNVTAVWNGTELTVSMSCSANVPPITAPGFEPSANACEAPTTWNLVGITGTATGSWQNVAASASGTLSFDVPQTVQEGTTVSVSATFSGSMTVNSGWSGYSTTVTAGIVDRGVPGLTVNNSANTGAVTGTKATAVTVSGSWTIPSNPTTLVIEAGGGYAGMTLVGAIPNLVATYRKAP